MFSVTMLRHSVILFTIIVSFSHCKNRGRWQSILNQMKGKVCPEDQENFTGNVAFVPEGIDTIRDVLPEICQHLNIRDLCSLRSVCKSLKEAADNEILKRYFEVRRIPISIDLQSDPEKNLRSTLKIKPKLALFFSDQEVPTLMYYDSLSRNLFNQYLPELPKECTMLHLMGPLVAVNRTEVKGDSNEALAVFFHENDNIKIRYYALNYLRVRDHCGFVKAEDQLLKKSLLQDLGSKSGKYHSFAYILFNLELPVYDDSEINSPLIINKLVQKYKQYPGKFALWGGNIFTMGSSIFEFDHFTVNFGASISGPGVKSWSLVIDTDMNESEIVKKLEHFKSAINLKSKSTIVLTMITYPDDRVENWSTVTEELTEKLDLFPKFFPDSTVVTYGINPNEMKYCVDSWVALEINVSPKLEYEDQYICYLVITYI